LTIRYQYDIEIDALDVKLIAIETCSELLKGLGTKLPNQQDEDIVAKELTAIHLELDLIGDKLAARIACVKIPKVTPPRDAAGKKDKKKDKPGKESAKTKGIVAGIYEKYDRKQNQYVHLRFFSVLFLLFLFSFSLLFSSSLLTRFASLSSDEVERFASFYLVSSLSLLLDVSHPLFLLPFVELFIFFLYLVPIFPLFIISNFIFRSLDSYRFQLESLLGNGSRILGKSHMNFTFATIYFVSFSHFPFLFLFPSKENWLRYTDRMKEAKDLMRKISSFVEFALLPFILEDFTILFCGQLEKLERTFTTVINK
jgi:hypothetical protein